MRLAPDASLMSVERVVEDGLARECRAYNQRKPLITVIAHEMDSRAGAAAFENAVRSANARMDQPSGSGGQGRGRGSAGRGRGRSSAGVSSSQASWHECSPFILKEDRGLNACNQTIAGRHQPHSVATIID